MLKILFIIFGIILLFYFIIATSLFGILILFNYSVIVTNHTDNTTTDVTGCEKLKYFFIMAILWPITLNKEV